MVGYYPTLAELLHNSYQTLSSVDKAVADHLIPLIVYKTAKEVRQPVSHQKDVMPSNVHAILGVHRQENVILNQFILVDHSALTIEVNRDGISCMHTERKPYGINFGLIPEE